MFMKRAIFAGISFCLLCSLWFTGCGSDPAGPSSTDLSGQWSGTWSQPGLSGSLSVTLSQSGDGINGSFTQTGNPCFSSGSVDGRVSGSSIVFGAVASGGNEVDYTGAIGSANTRISGSYTTRGPCVGGFSGSFEINKQQPPASISLNTSTIEIFPKETQSLIAAVRDADGNVLSVSVSWSSSNRSVAEVNPTGVVTGVAPGTATIEALVNGLSASATVTVLETMGFTFPLVGTLNQAFYYVNYVDHVHVGNVREPPPSGRVEQLGILRIINVRRNVAKENYVF